MDAVGLSWGIFIVIIFLIFLTPLIMGIVLLREAVKSKSLAQGFFGILSLALFVLILAYEPTRTMFLGILSLRL